ncbi:MAG: flavin reductase family protein [Lentisphaerae bacterium]|nr:flavin reductase family protein [Lentisphaerota bacterium]
MAVADETMKQLPKGAFLTVKHKKRLNTMTIGWGTIGIVWAKPVFVAAVRNTRYTYDLIQREAEFTVSLPNFGTCRQELGFCGTNSGKDVDKFAKTGLKAHDALKTTTPVIDIPGLHFECKTLLRAPIAPELLDSSLADVYPDADYHTFYFGDIVAAYRLESQGE